MEENVHLVRGSASATASAMLRIEVRRYHHILLDKAQELISQNDYQLTVIVAQMAGEICTETVIEALLKKHGLADLKEAIFGNTGSFNLTNDRVYGIYTKLSKDNPKQTCSHWKAYVEHLKRRNRTVHKGAMPTQNDAQESYAAVLSLTQHIEKVLPEAGGGIPSGEAFGHPAVDTVQPVQGR